MKTCRLLLSVFLFLSILDGELVLAQTFTQAGWQGPTRQGLRGCRGTQCQGVKTDHDCGPSDVQITPTFVTGTVGKPVETDSMLHRCVMVRRLQANAVP